jgi:probable phosphoglycerate mutase
MTTPHALFLARHGETEWSRAGKHTGRSDIPLTATGERDGARLRPRLAATAFDTVLTSPLSRARRTAELAGFAPAPEPGLLEWHYGEYEGLTTAEIRERRPGWDLFRDGCPGGESPDAVTRRADELIARLRTFSGNVLLFAHGHILRVLAARWVRHPVDLGRVLYLSTAAVCVLGYDHHAMEEPVVRLWNDVTHLA